MKRFALELPVMRRRLRAAHGRELSNGRVRKRSPFAGCAPSEHCGLCESQRMDARQTRRRERYEGRDAARVAE